MRVAGCRGRREGKDPHGMAAHVPATSGPSARRVSPPRDDRGPPGSLEGSSTAPPEPQRRGLTAERQCEGALECQASAPSAVFGSRAVDGGGSQTGDAVKRPEGWEWERSRHSMPPFLKHTHETAVGTAEGHPWAAHHAMRQLTTQLVRRAASSMFASAACPTWLASPAANSLREFSRAASRASRGAQVPRPPSDRCLVLARAASSSSKAKQLYVCSGCGEQTAQW